MDDDSNDRCEGLDKSYDLVILGTGLVQSIISCVASKHGKKVLHLETNEFYGEEYGSHTLSGHIDYYDKLNRTVSATAVSHPAQFPTQQHCNSICLQNEIGEEVIVQFIDNMTSFKGKALTRSLPKSVLTHPACFGYSMEKVETSESHPSQLPIHPAFIGYAPHLKPTKARIWLKDREFNIDTTAKVLYGSCPMVDLMVASGVGNYLEFKTFEGLYFSMDGTGTKSSSKQVWKVPCSRGDVFNTTMLSALEKRSLMKFHQFVADWGRVNCGTVVESLNETELAVGRSLYRPQNKQQEFSGYNVDKFEARPFEEFLNDCKISPKLQRIIIYALCCHMSPSHSSAVINSTCSSCSSAYLTKQGLSDMFMHIDSIGRFGETAFLSPMYGSSEVVQAFCRMSAVWGGTFILRRSVDALLLSENNKGGSVEHDTLPSAPQQQQRVDSVVDSEGNTIGCSAFVCSARYWPRAPTRQCAVVTCTSVWLGAVVPLARSIIIIPPSSARVSPTSSSNNPEKFLANEYAVHLIQTDSSTHATPDGAVVLHIDTIIDFVGSDQACCSSSWKESALANAPRAVDLIDAVINHLQLSMCAENEECASAVELSRVVALKPVYDLRSSSWESQSLPVNVHLCTGASDASLSMQTAYDQAKSIFQRIFPDKDFSLEDLEQPTDASQQMAAAVQEDDEAAYLEFALSAAQPHNHCKDCDELTSAKGTIVDQVDSVCDSTDADV